MPPTGLQSQLVRTLQDVAATVGTYPLDAYFFTQEGLHFAAERFHGEMATLEADASRHITGRQLCEGLRDLAIDRWGLMAPSVLRQWNVRSTHDFGRIVFAMIEAGLLQKQPGDTLADFDDVFDFRQAFDAGRYAIQLPARLDA
jgi:uncharacterized repeat protein (TIGR04138 family)